MLIYLVECFAAVKKCARVKLHGLLSLLGGCLESIPAKMCTVYQLRCGATEAQIVSEACSETWQYGFHTWRDLVITGEFNQFSCSCIQSIVFRPDQCLIGI